MNSPEQSLSPDTLDELLSADIDGEFDRAAVELGFTPEAARAALEASPAARPRRDALMQARSLLADPPTLAPAAESRLVAAALARADEERRTAANAGAARTVSSLPTHRARNAWRALAGVATAAAVIAGVVALSATKPGGNSAKSSSASRAISGAAKTPAAARDLQNDGAPSPVRFGAVMPPNAFRLKVRQQLQRSANAPAPTPTTGALSASPTAAAGQKNADSAAGESTVSIAKRRDCVASLGREQRIPTAPVLTGSGTNGTQPVFVAVYRQSSSYVVYVVSAADCSVVSRDTLP